VFAAAAAISNNNNNKERQGGSDRTEAPYVSEMGGRIAYAFIADVYVILYLLQQVSLSFFLHYKCGDLLRGYGNVGNVVDDDDGRTDGRIYARTCVRMHVVMGWKCM